MITFELNDIQGFADKAVSVPDYLEKKVLAGKACLSYKLISDGQMSLG